MAKAGETTETKKTGGISILAVLLLSLIAAGGGAGFGFMAPGMMKNDVHHKRDANAHEDNNLPPSATLTPFGPITTNLAEPPNIWIRIEGTLIADKSLGSDAPVVAKRVSGDILSYLRTISIAQLIGPSGFQHLREDLNDRVRIRSEGKVSELIVTSLIIE